MADLILHQDTEISLFESIKRFDEQGQECWYARELMTLLDFRLLYPGLAEYVYKQNELMPCRKILNHQETGLLILELAAILTLTNLQGASRDAAYLWNCAFSVYKGSSATFIFHSVLTQINAASQRETAEPSLYQFIDLHWRELMPFAKEIKKQVRIDASNIPDYVVNLNEPVEVKDTTFDSKALRQLQRYIRVMGAERGYAIAHECTVTLPEHIEFIGLDMERMNQISHYVPIEEKLRFIIDNTLPKIA